MSHANGARRRSGARESVQGSPRGEADYGFLRSLLARSSSINAPAAAEAAFQPRPESFVRIESCRMRDERTPSAHAPATRE